MKHPVTQPFARWVNADAELPQSQRPDERWPARRTDVRRCMDEVFVELQSDIYHLNGNFAIRCQQHGGAKGQLCSDGVCHVPGYLAVVGPGVDDGVEFSPYCLGGPSNPDAPLENSHGYTGWPAAALIDSMIL